MLYYTLNVLIKTIDTNILKWYNVKMSELRASRNNRIENLENNLVIQKIEISPSGKKEAVFTELGQVRNLLVDAFLDGKNPSVQHIRFSLEAAQYPVLEKRAGEANVAFQEKVKKLQEILEIQGEDAMLQELLQYFYGEVEYSRGSNSVVSVFDPKKKKGNCEGKAFASISLLEALGYQEGDLFIREFSNHLQVILRKKDGQTVVLDGHEPTPYISVEEANIRSLPDIKSSVLKLKLDRFLENEEIFFTPFIHEPKSPPPKSIIEDAKKRFENFLETLYGREVEPHKNHARAKIDEPLTQQIKQLIQLFPNAVRSAKAVGALAVFSFLYGVRTHHEATESGVPSDEIIQQDINTITEAVFDVINQQEQEKEEEESGAKEHPEKKESSGRNANSMNMDAIPTVPIPAHTFSDVALEELYAKNRSILSAADLVLADSVLIKDGVLIKKEIESPSFEKGDSISFSENEALRTLVLSSEVKSIDSSFWNFLIKDILDKNREKYFEDKIFMINITAPGVDKVGVRKILEAYDTHYFRWREGENAHIMIGVNGVLLFDSSERQVLQSQIEDAQKGVEKGDVVSIYVPGVWEDQDRLHNFLKTYSGRVELVGNSYALIGDDSKDFPFHQELQLSLHFLDDYLEPADIDKIPTTVKGMNASFLDDASISLEQLTQLQNVKLKLVDSIERSKSADDKAIDFFMNFSPEVSLQNLDITVTPLNQQDSIVISSAQVDSLNVHYKEGDDLVPITTPVFLNMNIKNVRLEFPQYEGYAYSPSFITFPQMDGSQIERYVLSGIDQANFTKPETDSVKVFDTSP